MCLATTDAGAQSTAPKAVDPRPGYTGLFKFTGGARERKAHDAAIERATEDLFFVIRGVARSRLRERTAIAEWVHFEFPDTRIKATVPGHAAAVSPASGAPTPNETGRIATRRAFRISESCAKRAGMVRRTIRRSSAGDRCRE